MDFKKGDKVRWNWGSGHPGGTIREIYEEKVTKTIKGSEITRNASPEEPAYLIEQDDGDQVIKSGSELQRA